MRRALLVLLPLLLLALPLPGGTAGAQSTGDRPVLALTLADSGRTVHVAAGTQVQVRLGTSGTWNGLERGTATLDVVRRSTQGGLSADLDALAPSSEPQRLSAAEDLLCLHVATPCAQSTRSWAVDVVVDPGPEPAPAACTPAPRAQPSPSPGAVYVTSADDGATVRMPRDGTVFVQLDGACGTPSWTPPTASGPLFRTSAGLDRTVATVDGAFRATATGTATVSASSDARCLHTVPSCAVVQRAFTVTVEVSASPAQPCTRPAATTAFEVSPGRVAAGDAVRVSGGHRDLCDDAAPEPVHDFRLLATPQGGAEREVRAVRATWFVDETLRPDRTTSYRLFMDGRPLEPFGSATVTVDRVSGSCTGLVLRGPARAAAGSVVTPSGAAPDTGTVTVLFRRRGEASFTARRTLVPGPDGRISTTFSATDDHRWYASTARCDSAPGLTQAVPVVTGPAVVRRGQTVTLRVLAPVGVRTLLFFRGPGEPFSPRRTFTGPGTTTYVATVDQRYYPRTPSTQGTPRLTQVR
ncbi:MAG: hypothetical protein JWM64_701 [Frankiales bacterium]|nr:hypothetical protein [Frankiales bacterium]